MKLTPKEKALLRDIVQTYAPLIVEERALTETALCKLLDKLS